MFIAALFSAVKMLEMQLNAHWQRNWSSSWEVYVQQNATLWLKNDKVMLLGTKNACILG